MGRKHAGFGRFVGWSIYGLLFAGVVLSINSGAAVAAPAVKSPAAESAFSAQRPAPAADKIPGNETAYSAEKNPAAATSIRVALFADPHSTDKRSREAMFEILSQAPGISVEKVTTPTVRWPAFFDRFDVFILPGGTGGGEASAIGELAGRAIARHVRNGKGLVAVCAGGYYVAEGWDADTSALDLINAQNHDGEHWARGEKFIAVRTLNGNKSDASTSRTMWYENGPIFKPAAIKGMPKYVPLVKYVSDLAASGAPKGQMSGRDAVIAAPYGQGRVVAFGPHPELSPDLHHWLVNAVKWAARPGTAPITVETVLEGKPAPGEGRPKK